MKSFSWIIYYCVMVMFCSAYSMQRYLSPRKLSALCYIVGEENKKDVVWEILLNHGIAFFDYTMIRSLAVNYHLNKLLRDSVDKRKMYLQRYASRSHIDDYTEYNRSRVYGAINGKVLIEDLNDLEHILTIERNYLSHPMRSPDSYNLNNFHSMLPHEPRPFFNQNGDFCFYGYGEKSNVLHEKSGKVVLYAVSAKGKYEVMGCVAHTRKKTFNLREFLEFPSLLKAFLSSREVYDAESDGTFVKVFDIKGVIIPVDYRCHKQYFSVIRYSSFSAFPEELENEIDALRKKQCARKNKKFWGII